MNPQEAPPLVARINILTVVVYSLGRVFYTDADLTLQKECGEISPRALEKVRGAGPLGLYNLQPQTCNLQPTNIHTYNL